jgi:hypothetical protein
MATYQYSELESIQVLPICFYPSNKLEAGMKSEVEGPKKEEMSLPTTRRLRDLDDWLNEELTKPGVKERLGRNIDVLLNFSQRRIGHVVRDVGCTGSHISRIRNAKATPSFLLLSTLATVLGTNVKVLLEVDLADEFQNILDQANKRNA